MTPRRVRDARQFNYNHWLSGRVLEGRRGRFRVVGEIDGHLFGRALDKAGRELGDMLYELDPDEWEQLERLLIRGDA